MYRLVALCEGIQPKKVLGSAAGRPGAASGLEECVMKRYLVGVVAVVFTMSMSVQAGLLTTPIQNASFEAVNNGGHASSGWGYEIDDWHENEAHASRQRIAPYPQAIAAGGLATPPRCYEDCQRAIFAVGVF